MKTTRASVRRVSVITSVTQRESEGAWASSALSGGITRCTLPGLELGQAFNDLIRFLSSF